MKTSPPLEATGMPGTVLQVAGWQVEPRELLLRRPGQERRLEQRVMSLLLCLVENPGRTVTREELLDRVWSDVVVGDDAVHSAVSKLRRALSHGGGSGRRAIETVPKVGYRLVAPVRREPEGTDGPEAGEAPPPAAPRRPPPRPAPPGDARLPGRWLVAALPILLLVAAGLSWTVRRGNGASSPPEIRLVTSWAGIEIEPALAPGDTADRLAFAWKGPDQDNWDLWLQGLGGGDPLRLTHHPGSDHSPAWSPDGRRLAFFRHHEGTCSLLQVPALGGPERWLGDCTGGEGLTWSPDGERLLWAARSSPQEPFRIVELTLEGRRRREVTSPPPGSVGDLAPAVSPDGATVAFLRSPVLGVEDLYLQPLAGGTPERLTRDDLKIHGADWMPDGESLVFSSNRGGLFSLWQIGVGGGEPRWLGASGGDLNAPSVGAGGRRIAFEQWNDDTNLYRLDLAPGAEPERVVASTRWDWAPHVAPSGDRVVFVSDRTGASELWSASLGTSRPDRQLTELRGPYLNHPRWHPSGTSVAFDGRPGGNADVYLLDGESLRLRRLTEHAAEDVAPSWSRDGRRLYFASDRSGTWQVWQVAEDGGEPAPVTRDGGYLAQESPDGRWLYHSRRHEAGIWRQPLGTGGPPELVIADLAPLDRAHWLVTGDSILYLRRPRADRPVLARFDLATGGVEEIAELGPIPYNSGLALAPEGRSIYFTRADRWESDLLVLELGS